jgi:hypothetical protein
VGEGERPPEAIPAAAPAPLRALLVGIDRYPEPAPGGFTYPSLYGAVHDVHRVEDYLRTTLGVPAEKITLLLAPHHGADPARLPVHANLTAALAELEAVCQPGEQALVYFSGHGGRAPTLVPEIKGARGLDEVLAPADIGDPAVPYLRDVEIGAWLARCAARGVFVTMILDCCHSGGAVRRDRRVRGNENVDRTPRPADRRLASREEIEALWRGTPPVAGADRVEIAPERAQAPRGYALLAACRPHERAVEVDAGGGNWGGVLTRCLLEVLRRADGSGFTYRRLHGAVTARLHAAGFLGQTPVLDGEADRLLFGRTRLPARRGVEVLEVVESWLGDRVRLATGTLHGTRVGERFALLAAGGAGNGGGTVADGGGGAAGREGGAAVGVSAAAGGAGGGPAAIAGDGAGVVGAATVAAPAPPARLAEVEVIDVEAATSWASPRARGPGARAARAGDAALLIDPGPLALHRTVAWAGRDGGPRAAEGDRSAWLATLLAEQGDGFLAAASPGAAGDFELIEVSGLIEIRDAGGTTIPNLGPPLALVAPGTARELARRLGHLARYWNIRSLENPDAGSPVAGALRLTIEPLPDPVSGAGAVRGGAAPGREPFMACAAAGDLVEVPAGARLRLTIENTGERVLNVAVLDLAPDWGIQQIHPHRDAAPWANLEPGVPIAVDLNASLPPGLAAGLDVLKAIASTGPFDLASLERPVLGAPSEESRRSRRRGAPAPADPFGRLLALLGAERGPDRVVRSGETAPESWTTAQVEVRVEGEGGAVREHEGQRSTRGPSAALRRLAPFVFERRPGP